VAVLPGAVPMYPGPQLHADPAFQQFLALREQVHEMQAVLDTLVAFAQAEQAKPEQAKPNHAKPEATKPEQTKPDNGRNEAAMERLKKITPAELAELGRTNKQAFFDVLRPAAEEGERKYGVPAAVTLAQAALETGWGKSLAAGYNLFGHKGTGPAGSKITRTREVYNGKSVYIDAKFAAYHNFFEAVELHGKRYHNGYYKKAMDNWLKYKDPDRFARDITGIYATAPNYGDVLIQLMNQYKLR
jgi:flagellum-specific peptidoglycan hydrolase FlgJ